MLGFGDGKPVGRVKKKIISPATSLPAETRKWLLSLKFTVTPILNAHSFSELSDGTIVLNISAPTVKASDTSR